jgi:hypothetical protein
VARVWRCLKPTTTSISPHQCYRGTSRGKRNARFYSCLPAWQPPPAVTSGQGRKPRSGGAERASLEGMAPVRPHGDKQVETPVALGDTQPAAEPLRRVGELYAIEASVLEQSSSTYRRTWETRPFSRPMLQSPPSRPAWLQRFAHLLARACKSRCRASPARLKATYRTAPGSRSRPRSGGALGRAGLDPTASADRKLSTTGSTSFNRALIRSDRSVCLAQVSDGLPADRRR